MAGKLSRGRSPLAKWIGWSPSDRVHRVVNVGEELFEEVVTFFLDRPDAVPQPEDDS